MPMANVRTFCASPWPAIPASSTGSWLHWVGAPSVMSTFTHRSPVWAWKAAQNWTPPRSPASMGVLIPKGWMPRAAETFGPCPSRRPMGTSGTLQPAPEQSAHPWSGKNDAEKSCSATSSPSERGSATNALIPPTAIDHLLGPPSSMLPDWSSMR